MWSQDLGEPLRRIGEAGSMIRTKGEAGTGDIVQAVRHMRTMMAQIRQLKSMAKEERMFFAKEIGAPFHLLEKVAQLGKLPVANFAAGGIATPADAALMMQLGSDGVFVGSGIFKSGNTIKRAKAIVEAVKHYENPKKLAEIAEDLGEEMKGEARA